MAYSRGPIGPCDCVNCPFSVNGSPIKPVQGEGDSDPKFLVIAEGPGQVETRLGRPFVGPSGKMLDRALASIHVERSQIYIGNATSCLPTKDATDAQKRIARECCKPRLIQELTKFPGKPILALGGIAAQFFCGDKFSITQMAGSLWHVDVDGTGKRYVIPSMHPAAILRGGGGNAGGAHAVDLLYWCLVYDAMKVSRIAEGDQAIFFQMQRDIEWQDPVRAEELVLDFIKHAWKTKVIALDTETYAEEGASALDSLNAKLSAIGLATTERAISVSWELVSPRIKGFLKKILADKRFTIICHNALYDMGVMRAHGMPIDANIGDTLLQHHNAFPGLAHDLQRVSTQFFAIPPWKAEYRAGEGSMEELLNYNSLDVGATAKLYEVLTVLVKKYDAEKTYKVDIEMAKIAARMHEYGVPVSREVNSQIQVHLQERVDKAKVAIEAKAHDPEIRERFLEHLAKEQAKRRRKNDDIDYIVRFEKRLEELREDPPPFRLDSGEHIAAYLKARNVPLHAETEKGKLSTKKDVLEGLVHIPEVRSLIVYRENRKLLSTFVIRLPEYMDGFDRMHPRWNVHRITGRWSGEAPSIQNWPKANKKKDRVNLRSQVVAPKGRIFVGADYKQLEARVIALLSGDEFLSGIFHSNKDIHIEFARITWPDFDSRSESERKELRDLVKRPEYGSLYGAAIETSWRAVVKDYPNVRLEDIALMIGTMRKRMTGVERWHQELLIKAEREGELRSFLYGRRRCFPLRNADPSEVWNFPVQSSGADIMNTGLMRLMAKLPPSAHPILQIHDAIVVECNEDDAELVKQLVIDALTQQYTLNGNTIDFGVDCHVGKSWADV